MNMPHIYIYIRQKWSKNTVFLFKMIKLRLQRLWEV